MRGAQLLAVELDSRLVIVAASGLAPAPVASIGQALGDDSLKAAKKHANAALRLGLIAGLLFSVLLIGSSFLVPFLYQRWQGSVTLHLLGGSSSWHAYNRRRF
jgi:Na+-driven multidrug efflux pump